MDVSLWLSMARLSASLEEGGAESPAQLSVPKLAQEPREAEAPPFDVDEQVAESSGPTPPPAQAAQPDTPSPDASGSGAAESTAPLRMSVSFAPTVATYATAGSSSSADAESSPSFLQVRPP